MNKIIKESIKLTNSNLTLATPLIIFSIITGTYMLFSAGGSKLSLIFTAFLLFLMLSAFLSGWLYMISLKIQKTEESNFQFVKDFTEGIGKYFLSVCGLIIISFIFILVTLLLVKIAGNKIIGNIGISAESLRHAMVSPNALKTFIMSLSQEQIIKLNQWNILILSAISTAYFLLIFYFPTLFFKNKNPLISFFICIKDLFSRKFFKTILLYIFLMSVYFVISILSALSGQNIVANFIITLINFYYIVFASILVFNYYYLNFIKIGSNINLTV